MGFVIRESTSEFKEVKIKVIGIGGGGCNAVSRLSELGLTGVDIVGINSDHRSLEACQAPIKILLGNGLGAGPNPERGRELALEAKDRMREVLEGADMVFVTACMGGGTGTGGAPVVAQLAKEAGALVTGVVTKPSAVEGMLKLEIAERGIDQLRGEVDSLILISNQKLTSIVDENTLLKEALMMTSDILVTAVRSVLEPLFARGIANIDFTDVKTAMSYKGLAIMGIGRASGNERAIQAADRALDCQLLEGVSIEGAKALLIYITGKDVRYTEANQAFNHIRERTGQNSFMKWGAADRADDVADGDIQIIVIATGFEHASDAKKYRTDSFAKARVDFSQTEHAAQPQSYLERLKDEWEQKRRITAYNDVQQKPNVKVISDAEEPLDDYDIEGLNKVASAKGSARATGKKFWSRRPD